MAGGWWCCCKSCWYAFDDFEREPSTDLGPDWAECSGDWDIWYSVTDDETYLRANSDGLVVWMESPIATGDRTGTMNITIIDAKDGDHYRVYGFYGASQGTPDSCTAGSWIAADLTITLTGGALVGSLTLVSSLGAVTTSGQPITNNVGNEIVLTLCVGLTSVRAFFTGATYPIRLCHATEYNDQLYFALENLTDTVVLFDKALQQDHYDHDTTCPSCACSCEGECMPLALCLTIHDAEGCANIDHTALDMTLSSPCQWISEAWTCGPFANMRFNLIPQGTDVMGRREWTLTFVSGAGATIWTGSATANSTCDPLYLEFGPFFPPGPTPYSTCCTGVECADSEGGTCIDYDPNPSVEYWWRPGSITVTIVEGPCA